MKVKLRTPNEMSYSEFDLDPNEFIVKQIFNTEVFGRYQGMTVSIDIESYKKIQKDSLTELVVFQKLKQLRF